MDHAGGSGRWPRLRAETDEARRGIEWEMGRSRESASWRRQGRDGEELSRARVTGVVALEAGLGAGGLGGPARKLA